MDIQKRIHDIGIVPVIKIDNASDALPLAKALIDGGLPVAEVTFRTEAGKDAIKIMSDNFPDMLVGAGTVLTTQQVDEAIAAGAKFIVSPGLNPETVEYCIAKNIPIYPGCTSASDVEKAISYGLEVVKFFPAEAMGGLSVIKALAGPFSQVRFMPTGGVNLQNLQDYLGFDRIIACGGTWMVQDALIKEGRFDEIETITREAVGKMLGLHIAHVGVNPDQEASKSAKQFATLLGLPLKEGNTSFFIDSIIEVMKEPYLGKNGHIAIGTKNIDRAIFYYENKGITFNPDSKKYNDKGELVAIYFTQEINGFALHLVQK